MKSCKAKHNIFQTGKIYKFIGEASPLRHNPYFFTDKILFNFYGMADNVVKKIPFLVLKSFSMDVLEHDLLLYDMKILINGKIDIFQGKYNISLVNSYVFEEL